MGTHTNTMDNEEEEFEPNSKQMRQSDLQDIYTGPQIEAGEKFAQTFNVITICLMYSVGLPILYFIATISFIVAYWFNKAMLMRYYQKTYEFNELLPLKSQSFMKLGICLHLCLSIAKISNGKLLQEFQSISTHFEYKTEF